MGATHNIVIVGSGQAAPPQIDTARADLEPVLIEGLGHCGVLMQTTGVENFPGFVDGIDGPELMSDLGKQAKRFGTAMITADKREIPALGALVGRVGAHASARLAHR
jgi:thioredoxin reductase (NADPH)